MCKRFWLSVSPALESVGAGERAQIVPSCLEIYRDEGWTRVPESAKNCPRVSVFVYFCQSCNLVFEPPGPNCSSRRADLLAVGGTYSTNFIDII